MPTRTWATILPFTVSTEESNIIAKVPARIEIPKKEDYCLVCLPKKGSKCLPYTIVLQNIEQ